MTLEDQRALMLSGRIYDDLTPELIAARARAVGLTDAYNRSFGQPQAEREALLNFDVRRLYEMGVHGLLLRPFTIMHKMSDPDYIKALRGE